MSSRRYGGEGEGHTDAGHDTPLAEPPAHCRHNSSHLIHTLGILLDERGVEVEEYVFRQFLDPIAGKVVVYIYVKAIWVYSGLLIARMCILAHRLRLS